MKPLLSPLLALLLLPAGSLFGAADLCVVCGAEITATAYLMTDQIAGEKRIVCGQCAELTSICYLCGMPVKQNPTELADGRILCARDVKSVVLDKEEADRLCHETRQALDRHFSRFLTFPETNVTVSLADRVSLLAFYKMPGQDYQCPNVLGYVQTRTNQQRLHHDISLMSGLQPSMLRSTLAHEFTHAWMAENLSPERTKSLSRDAVEGFCELVAWLLMGDLGDQAGQQAITRNHYTRGQVNLFIEAEQRFGFNEVVDWMQSGLDSRLVAGQVDRLRTVVAQKVAVRESKPDTQPPVVVRPPAAEEKLTLNGITWAGGRSLASINNRTLAVNEVSKVQLGGTNVTIRCLEIKPDAVWIQVVGSEEKQMLRLSPK